MPPPCCSLHCKTVLLGVFPRLKRTPGCDAGFEPGSGPQWSKCSAQPSRPTPAPRWTAATGATRREVLRPATAPRTAAGARGMIATSLNSTLS
jgi:hypothetical protein